MALMDEVDQVMQKYQGGAQGPTGSFWDIHSNAIFQQTSDGALPATNNWWFIPTATAGNESLATCATKINTALNALSPIAGPYAYVAGSFHTYTSADLPTSKGTGAQDA
jgi:hypothetical protein